MKHINAILTLLVSFGTLSSFNAFAIPVAFERNYTNTAWGVYNDGCFIDENRYVYVYNILEDTPIRVVSRVPEDGFKRAKLLLESVARTSWESERVGADMGSIKVTGTLSDGSPVLFKESGDIVGRRGGVRGVQLVELINGWCPRLHEAGNVK